LCHGDLVSKTITRMIVPLRAGECLHEIEQNDIEPVIL